LLPTSGGGDVCIVPVLRAVRQTLAAIYFRRGIVRPKGKLIKKGRAIMSFWLGLQDSLPASVRAAAISLASADPALGFPCSRVLGVT
jgi:hypothetical protein